MEPNNEDPGFDVVAPSTQTQQRRVSLSSGVAPSETGFGRYAFGDELGRGGLGMVRAAEDTNLRREVAIKTLLDPRGSDLAAFIEEAQITGQLEHPNIVPLHELGFDPEGRPYMAMKRVQGRTLRAEIARSHQRRHATDADHAAGERHLLEVLVKTCDAVGYAHSRGVVHRDLKPDNVMVGEFGEVLVMDWGLAKPMADDAGDAGLAPAGVRSVSSSRRERVVAGSSTELTMEGDVFGTPAYMPPEQAEGRVADMGPRADIYSLGAILYSILTGQSPFTGDSAVAVLQDVRAGRLVPPSERGGERRVPRELEAVVMRAMAHDPRDRYATAGELRADIERYLTGRTLTAADYTSWQLLWKWTRRHKVAVAGGLSTAAAVIIGLLAVIVSRAEARQQEIDKQKQAAVAFVEAAREELDAAEPVPFNPASPQDYYGAWLPPMLKLGRAIQTHPSPPDDWREELAGYCQTLQDHAASIGDWGMARHVAESAGAWGAVSDADSAARVESVRAARAQRAEEDRQRLEVVLDRIEELERPHDGGEFHGHNPHRYTVNEFGERAMRIASRTRKDTAPLARTVIRLLQEDPPTCRRFGLAKPTWVQRHFLVGLAGHLRDSYTEVDGVTLADMAVAELTRDPLPADKADEAGWWMEAAARLDCAADRPISTRLGRPLRELGQQIEDMRGRIHVSLVIASRMASDLMNAADGIMPTASDLQSSDRLAILKLSEWLVASARSGSDYTDALLTAAEERKLPKVQQFVLDQLGQWGDRYPPDITRPDRSAPAVLMRELKAIPFEQTRLASRPGEPDFDRAVICVRALSRLEVSEAWMPVFERLLHSQRASAFYLACGTSGMLFPPPSGVEPTTAHDHMVHAMSRAVVGDYDGALADLDEAVRLAPDHARPRGMRASLRAYMGRDMERAHRDVDEARRLEPDNVAWLQVRALLHDAANDPEAAIAAYTAVIAHPSARNHAAAYSNRARMKTLLGDVDGAMADYNSSIEVDGSLSVAWFGRGLLRIQLGDRPGALSDLAQAVRLEPTFVKALCAISDQVAAAGENGQALVFAATAVHLDPTSTTAWATRAHIHQIRREVDRAISDYSRTIDLDPDMALALNNRALLYRDAGRLDEALADFDRVVEAEPGRWRGWAGRGQIAARLGRRILAEACFARALELCEPQFRQAVRQLARSELGD